MGVLKQTDIPTNTTVSVYDYCHNICNITDVSPCKTFSQSEDVYYGILVTLWILLALSTLEGILERFFGFMPHRQFLKPIPKLDIPNPVEQSEIPQNPIPGEQSEV